MPTVDRSTARRTPFAPNVQPHRIAASGVEFEGHRLTQQALRPTLPVSEQLRHLGSGTAPTMCPRLEQMLEALDQVSLAR